MEKNIIKDAILEVLQEIHLRRTTNGFEWRKRRTNKSDFTPKRVTTSQSNFVTSVKTSTLIRRSVQPLIGNLLGKGAHGKHMKKCYAVLKTDTINKVGDKNPHYGDLSILRDFELNHKCAHLNILFAPCNKAIDREKGIISMTYPAFCPERMMVPVKGATHFKIISAGVEINLLSNYSKTQYQESDFLPINDEITNDVTHIHQVKPNNPETLMLVVAVQLFQKVNGEYYRLLDKRKNAVTIREIDFIDQGALLATLNS